MMDAGQDPKKGIFPSLGLIVSWLLVVTNSITFPIIFIQAMILNLSHSYLSSTAVLLDNAYFAALQTPTCLFVFKTKLLKHQLQDL